MKIQQIRIAAGVTVKGEPKILYCGWDAAKADAAVAIAGPEYEVVGSFPKGIAPVMPRYPAKEIEAAKIRASAAQVRADADIAAKKAAVAQKTEQAKKLTAEAAALNREISKAEK